MNERKDCRASLGKNKKNKKATDTKNPCPRAPVPQKMEIERKAKIHAIDN
jgi:hypothetical protein